MNKCVLVLKSTQGMCKRKKVQMHLFAKKGNISSTECFYVACFTFVLDDCSG